MTAIPNNEWFLDKESDNKWLYHRIKKSLISVTTKFQQVKILETYDHGVVVILDNKIQSAESDEFIYHETLVHPVMLAHPDPRRVLVLGGGEGAVLREVLRHNTVERVVMVDIDGEFVDLCKKHLYNWHHGAFLDNRVKLVISDANHYLKDAGEKFDVVIADISDPVEEGPAIHAYTREFYERIYNVLTQDGGFVTQAMQVVPGDDAPYQIVNRTLSGVFPIVESYCEYISSFTSLWGFVAASRKHSLRNITAQQIEERLISRRVTGLRHYDSETHLRLFALPLWMRYGSARQGRLSTQDEPLTVYSNR